MPLYNLAPVVQRADNAMTTDYLVDSAVCFVNIYPLDSGFSGLYFYLHTEPFGLILNGL